MPVPTCPILLEEACGCCHSTKNLRIFVYDEPGWDPVFETYCAAACCKEWERSTLTQKLAKGATVSEWKVWITKNPSFLKEKK